MSEPALLEASGLVKSFRSRARPGGRLVAVNGVDLVLRRGETLALIGESGSGKSTLARCLTGIFEIDGGHISWSGHDPRQLAGEQRRRLRRGRQLLFQDSAEALNPRRTAGQALDEALRQETSFLARGSARVSRAELVEKRRRLLEEVGLEAEHALRYPHQLSGGQRQRLALARALAADPDLLILDEPVSGLDAALRLRILDLLETLRRRRGLAQLIISHDLGAARRAQSIAVMYLGRIVEHGPAARVLDEPRHPYTAGLLASRPRLDGRRGVFTVMPGEVPNPESPPAGCAFHPRCSRASAECKEKEPPLREPPLAAIEQRRSVACWHPLGLDLRRDDR